MAIQTWAVVRVKSEDEFNGRTGTVRGVLGDQYDVMLDAEGECEQQEVTCPESELEVIA